MKVDRRSVFILALMATVAACAEAPAPTEVARLAREPGKQGELRGWIIGRGGQPVEVSYTVVDGSAVIEEDIVIGDSGSIPSTREELVGRSAKLSIIESSTCVGGFCVQRRWPSGEVPYQIFPGFSSAEVDSIRAGLMLVASRAGGVSFRPRRSYDQNWLDIKPHASVCNSTIGRYGNNGVPSFTGPQAMNLAAWCASRPGVIAHEALHTLGAWHEQSRCDRDSYVTINTGNIQSGAEGQFQKHCGDASDVLAYTEESIMHYGPYAFAENYSIPTIVSLRGRPMGQRDSLMPTDWSSINMIYTPRPLQVISLTEEGGHARLIWSAQTGATGYSVELIPVYEEYDDISGTYYYSEGSAEGVGFSTTPTILDTPHAWTGWDRCFLTQDPGFSQSYYYVYQIRAHFPFGVVGSPVRTGAPVAPEAAPCTLY